jgi:hypothetical protein
MPYPVPFSPRSALLASPAGQRFNVVDKQFGGVRPDVLEQISVVRIAACRRRRSG